MLDVSTNTFAYYNICIHEKTLVLRTVLLSKWYALKESPESNEVLKNLLSITPQIYLDVTTEILRLNIYCT